MNLEERKKHFFEKAKQVHGDKYDYSNVNYVNDKTKVCIICPEHGEFLQEPHSHLKGTGCPKCNNGGKYNTKTFIEKSKKLNGDKYDYSKVEYVNSYTKVCIICPEHGEFWQIPYVHLKGCGCPKCDKSSKTTKEEFINRSKQVHGNKYNYSKVEYVNNHTKVCIICPEHGEFWQQPRHHLIGLGCQICNESSLENEIRVFLENNAINYIPQCRKNVLTWLGRQSLDFYLPDYNIAIECQGEQHFKENIIFGGKNEFIKRIERDKIKKEICEKNGVKLLYYSNIGIIYPYSVIENKDILLNLIKNGK